MYKMWLFHVMYADDGQLQVSSNSRGQNQDNIDTNFWKICNFLEANGLQVNQGKTNLTEFMCHQKRSKTRGIPPDLTVSEETTDRNGVVSRQDKHITDQISCRMLGLTLKNDLTWDHHLNQSKKGPASCS